MPIEDMPAAEIELDAKQVAALLEEQWSGWDRQAVSPLAFGWDNFLFRVGGQHVARFPRRAIAVPLLENEARWLPELAPRLSLPVPVPLLVGLPGHGYPWPWSLVPWIDGESAAVAPTVDHAASLGPLATFLRGLHVPAPADAPSNPYRGTPLVTRNESTLERAHDLLERPASALEIWRDALGAPEQKTRFWLHGDLHPHNLLVTGGRLSGVVDFGDLCAGDHSTDLAIMWSFLPPALHHTFVERYGGSDTALWSRARGWALSLGLAYVGNSGDNPVMAVVGRRMLDALGVV